MLAVPFRCSRLRVARYFRRTVVDPRKAVVRGQHQDGSPSLRDRPVSPHQLIDGGKVPPRHVAVALVVLARNRRLPRGRVRTEGVPDAVGALNVKNRQVWSGLLHPRGRQVVVHTGLDERASQRADRIAVRVLGFERALVVRGCQPWEELFQRTVIDGGFRLLHNLASPRLMLARCDHTLWRLRFLEQKREQAIRDHQAVDGLGRIGRPEPEHRDGPSGPARHVPNGWHPTFVAGDRLLGVGSGPVACEIQDAVRQGIDAGHHGGPDERRQRRVERFERARRAFGDELRQVGHGAVPYVAVEELPVGPIEPQEDHRWRLAAVFRDRLDGAGVQGRRSRTVVYVGPTPTRRGQNQGDSDCQDGSASRDWAEHGTEQASRSTPKRKGPAPTG